MKTPEELNKHTPATLARYWVTYLTPKEIKEGDWDFEMAVRDLEVEIIRLQQDVIDMYEKNLLIRLSGKPISENEIEKCKPEL